MEGAWDEQLHAMDYLMYAYLQGAQDKQAKAVLDDAEYCDLLRPCDAIGQHDLAGRLRDQG